MLICLYLAEDKSGVFSLTKYIELMKQPGAMPLLLIRLVSGNHRFIL